MKTLRANDTARLRDKIAGYLPRDPAKDAVIPPIYASSKSRSQMGLNHPLLARMLCPILSLKDFLAEPERTRQRLESGDIEMCGDEYPSFLWANNGDHFDVANIHDGLFGGFFLEQVMRHIFTGPSTWSGDEARGFRASNAELLDIQRVVAGNIAYACVQAHFGISSRQRWGESDGNFNYCDFYYSIIEDIEEAVDDEWREELFEYYNK
ncbi:hypothetical protein JVU11DRAFT_7629 [Chiua virens]|nr:hypothetical protein JVU11DRAFT_7629 [Chiua virens]